MNTIFNSRQQSPGKVENQSGNPVSNLFSGKKANKTFSVKQELEFLEQNRNNMFWKGVIPSEVPQNPSLERLINNFKMNRDYYAINQRIKTLKSINSNPVNRMTTLKNDMLKILSGDESGFSMVACALVAFGLF